MTVPARTETTLRDLFTTTYALIGKAMVAYNPASSAMGASEPEGEDNRVLARLMPPDVELVHFGADFVLCYREPSDAEAAEIERQFEEARANRDPDELAF